MKIGIILSVFAALVLAVGPVVSHGAVFAFNENFESYTITGGDDDPTNPGDGNPNNWSVVEGHATNVQVQANGYGGGEALRVLNPVTGFMSVGRAFEPVNDDIFFLGYKVRFNTSSLNNNTGGLRTLLGGPGNSTPVALYMRPGVNGFIAVSSGFTSHVMIPTIIQDDWYQVNLRVNAGAGLWDIAITNLNSTAAGQAASLANLTINGISPTYYNTFTITDSAGTLVNTFDTSFDSIFMQLIPEPSVVGLLLTGGLLLRVGRRLGKQPVARG